MTSFLKSILSSSSLKYFNVSTSSFVSSIPAPPFVFLVLGKCYLLFEKFFYITITKISYFYKLGNTRKIIFIL
nr:MAG TPA: hypothetical protein [Caudoviricetes sp.]